MICFFFCSFIFNIKSFCITAKKILYKKKARSFFHKKEMVLFYSAALLCFALVCFALLCFALLCFSRPRNHLFQEFKQKKMVRFWKTALLLLFFSLKNHLFQEFKEMVSSCSKKKEAAVCFEWCSSVLLPLVGSC